MKNKIKILIFFSILFLTNYSVGALSYGGCDYSTISDLKSQVTNINVSYTYEIIENEAYFNVTLNNIPKDVYFIDKNTGKKYFYDNTLNGEITINGYSEITGGRYNFFVYNNVCNEVKLGTKYYNFPIYNKRYNSEPCKGIENYYLCKKWISKYYSNEEFNKKIEEYKNSKKNETLIDNEIKYEKDITTTIVEFYIKYYYLFLPVLIVICFIIMHISKKKNSFKL